MLSLLDKKICIEAAFGGAPRVIRRSGDETRRTTENFKSPEFSLSV